MAEGGHGNGQNFEQFRDCLSAVLIERLTTTSEKTRARRRADTQRRSRRPETSSISGVERSGDDQQQQDDAEELADFIEYIAAETFDGFPADLKSLNHRTWSEEAWLAERYPLPLTGAQVSDFLQSLDPAISESLITYGVVDDTVQGVDEFLAPVLTAFITSVTTPPPPPSSARGKVIACEICGRDWINLTYHHLIPRFVHAKVIKRGWHREDELNNVAWLCAACHRFVHHFASHEDLARQYYTVDLLLGQEEVAAFASWVGRLRWKAGRTRSRR